MSKLILFTSGSTTEPKEVTHSWEYMKYYINNSISEMNLVSSDIVLNVFPSNTIAYHTITAGPAIEVGATLISIIFDPYNYIKVFNKYRPTVISLIPRHYEILKNTKNWKSLDMSCVRYMVTGSSPFSQEMIDDLLDHGVKVVSNWYGMTEMPPPVFVGNNSIKFDFTSKDGYFIEFSDDGECIINGFYTGDIFDVKNRIFLYRKNNATNITWKNNFN